MNNTAYTARSANRADAAGGPVATYCFSSPGPRWRRLLKRGPPWATEPMRVRAPPSQQPPPRRCPRPPPRAPGCLGYGGRRLNKEREEKAVSARDPKGEAMPEKRTGAQDAGGGAYPQGLGRPSVYQAAIVISLELFAWGLLTTPMLPVLHETFPQHTFLMNDLIQGVKGLLSFLSAPLIGALSDVWGRKPFLLGTVFFTYFPIPLMRISP